MAAEIGRTNKLTATSKKHLLCHLAEFYCRFNRTWVQLGERVNRLAYVALKTPLMPQRLLELADIR